MIPTAGLLSALSWAHSAMVYNGKSMGFGCQKDLCVNPVVSFNNLTIVGRLFHCSVPQFPHWKNGDYRIIISYNPTLKARSNSGSPHRDQNGGNWLRILSIYLSIYIYPY